MDFIATIADSIQLNFPVLVDHKYILLLLLSSLEGLSGIILAGLLASLGVVEIVPAVIICLIGDFINGWLWYSVGYFGGAGSIDRWGRKHPKSREIIETIERYFHLYSGRVIVLTKITWSVTIFAMIVAGAFRYNLKKFALYNLIGAFGWVAIVFTAGYFFGKGYQAIAFINNVGLTIIFFVAIILIFYGFKVLSKTNFIKPFTPKDDL